VKYLIVLGLFAAVVFIVYWRLRPYIRGLRRFLGVLREVRRMREGAAPGGFPQQQQTSPKKAANEKLKAGANGTEDRMKAKLVTGKFFMERVLPESAAHLKRITTGADTMMALPAEAF